MPRGNPVVPSCLSNFSALSDLSEKILSFFSASDKLSIEFFVEKGNYLVLDYSLIFSL